MTSQIPSSQKTFLSKIIDYAGLFPPASLPLEEALSKFVHYQSDPDSWMLSRFIIPTRLLPELTFLLKSFYPGEVSLTFSALGHGGTSREDYFAGLASDLRVIEQFRQANRGRVKVDMYETRLPAGELSFQIRADNMILEAADSLIEIGLTPYFEAPFDKQWKKNAGILIQALQKTNREHTPDNAGFKLRTGGLEANKFPTPAQVAWAITTARDAGVPMKATAGLHHPIRRYSESLGTKMHGFLNVFGAGVLARAYDLSSVETQRIIEDEAAENFHFDGKVFSWKNRTVSEIQIEDIRRSTILSFGSCSFDEPREDLSALGMF